MLNIAFIRHSMTYGNQMKRYIGTTDEPLSKAGIELLDAIHYPEVQKVYTSPLKRCIQTVKRIYPENRYQMIEELSECDFGEFENKNYMELADNKNYQAWIDSNGKMQFPGGESRNDFRSRCLEGFHIALEDAAISEYHSIALVVHGGTIMNILDEYSKPHEDFYHWQVDNGQGYLTECSQDNAAIHIVGFIGKKKGN